MEKRIHTVIFIVLIPFSLFGQDCVQRQMAPESDFKSKSQFARYDVGWYDEWLEHTGGKKVVPKPLPLQPKWDHPYMKHGYTAAMHEGPRSSDVSNRPGPLLDNIEVQYFHVLQKGGGFSGMCPTFAFIDDSTMVTLSFGRANTTLLLLDIKDTIKVLDYVAVPGRGSSAFELAGKKGRSKIFSNTAGGAYSYLSDRNNIYIPGADNNILKITIKDRKFENHKIASINLKSQIEAGNLVDPHISEKDQLNKLTALIPDVNGNIWLTSRQGIVGLIHRTDTTADGCPKVYSTFIGYFGWRTKLERYYPESLQKADQLIKYIESNKISPEIRTGFRNTIKIDENTHEEIQNSFSVGKDGVTSQIALKREKEAANLKSENLNSELKFLRSQINPHFLFNALNNIYSLSIIKSDKTPDNILKLSDMLRYIIYDCNANRVPLEKEINYINNYIDLQKLKDDQMTNIEVDFENTDPKCLIAPMIFIPFIENSFKHSKIEDLENGWIKMKIENKENQLIFSIRNGLPEEDFTKDKVGGVGLENVRRRLELLYPGKHQLKIEDSKSEFIVELKISLES